MSTELKYASLGLLTIGVAAAMFLLSGPIPQPVEYHNFADIRGWLGLPNFGDVVSNLPFSIFGFYALWVMSKITAPGRWTDDVRLPLVVALGVHRRRAH